MSRGNVRVAYLTSAVAEPMRTATFSLVLALALSTASAAHGQAPSAEDLFREGVSLFSRGETAAACDRFERSYKLDAAPGTLFNVANCHERQGRLWQARLEFADLVERATVAGKTDKAILAKQRLAAVEARLPRLSFAFSPATGVDTILIDDVGLPEPAWHSPVPVDVGAHTLEFRGAGLATTKVAVAARDPAIQRVEVPVLVRESPRASLPIPAPVTAVAPSPAPTVPPQPTQATAPHSTVSAPRIVGYVVGAVGLGGLGVGAYFVSQAVSEKNEGNAACHGSASGVCANGTDTATAQHDSSLSQTSTIEAGVAFGVGLVGVVSGVVLIATGHDTVAAATNVQLAPLFGSHVSGLSLSGRF